MDSHQLKIHPDVQILLDLADIAKKLAIRHQFNYNEVPIKDLEPLKQTLDSLFARDWLKRNGCSIE